MTNSDGQDIIEETGSGVYHKYYETENKKVETIGDKTKTTETISDNDTLTKIKLVGNQYCYLTHSKNTDKFGRTTSELMHKDTASVSKNLYNKEYSYMTIYNGNTTDKVSKITYTGAYNKTFRYGYDGCGNISEINDMWYLYDEAGQLTTEVNIKTDTGKDYVYDKGGNITEVRHFENGEYGETDKYTYGNSNWKDLLTEYNGNKITYDEIGNPLTYYNGMEFSWTMGRRLESVTNGKSKTRYTYNADGLRTSKIINGTRFNYYWNGDKLTAQTWPGNTLYFYYDKDGNPIAFEYNDVFYYYITNLQGDIVAILRTDGIIVAEYEYDAWGNFTILRNTNNIANTNPLRYRGYYYDTGTNLYYLQSRYYDANIGRFINADDAELLGMSGGVVSNNLFAYCDNNPINKIDPNGHIAVSTVIKTVINAISGYFVGKAIANYFKLKGWKRKVCIATSSLFMTVIGLFSPVSVYNAIKAAISSTASVYLTKKGYTLSRDMFNHAIYGYGKSPGSNIKNNMISKLKSSTEIKNAVKVRVNNANKNKKSSFATNWFITEFKYGDLYYSIQHASVRIVGKKTNGKWTITVDLNDKYDFTEFGRTFKYGLSVGNVANDLGSVMQKVKMLYPYSFSVKYSYKY